MFTPLAVERFTREQGCTQTEWERDLPAAAKPHRVERPAPCQAVVQIDGGGQLHLVWLVLPPRQIGLIHLPRLQVEFRFEQVDARARTAFMRRFDLFLQRGGG